METIIHGLLTDHVSNFVVLLFFGIVGANLNVGFAYLNRNKSGRDVPKNFNVKFFLQDNWLRMALSLGLIYCAERFGHSLAISLLPFGPDAIISGSDEQLLVAFAIGWSVDLLPHIFRKYLRLKTTVQNEG